MDHIKALLETDDEAIKTCDQLIKLLVETGFKTRQWCRNRPKVLEDVSLEDHVANVNIEESERLHEGARSPLERYNGHVYLQVEPTDGH